MPATTAEKSARFVSLHQQDQVFTIPNPWDIGSARFFEALGFAALATTSSGFAQSIGRLDGEVTLDETLRHCEELAAATSIPVSVDFESGFGQNPESVANNIRRVAETGAVGASIEDYTGDQENPIYTFDLAVERVVAAVEAARTCSSPFTLTVRAEQLLRAEYDMEETIRRLQAYESAGADVLYAPGLKTLDDVQRVANSLGKPINVLGSFFPDHSIADLGAAGAKRVSIGGGLARLAASVTIRAAIALQEQGDLAWIRDTMPSVDIDRLLGGLD
jgi:2-methylisocitrate lyase-like PEP mutase family enzyme